MKGSQGSVAKQGWHSQQAYETSGAIRSVVMGRGLKGVKGLRVVRGPRCEKRFQRDVVVGNA